MNGSVVMAKMAGIESTAKITSVTPTRQDHQQQRRGDAPAVLDGEELLAVEAGLTGISCASSFSAGLSSRSGSCRRPTTS
jgi:hypothetical protein